MPSESSGKSENSMLLRLTLLLVMAAALMSLPLRRESGPVTSYSTAREALLAWFYEHAGEFDNFFHRGEPVDKDQERPCEGCTWFCVRESSPQEILYGVGLTWDAPSQGCGGETVRVIRQGAGWRAERAASQISLGNPSWQEIVERLRHKFLQPREVEVQKLSEGDDIVVVRLTSPENPSWSGYPDRYRFSKGPDGLWRGYVSFEPALNRYTVPADLLSDVAISNFPTRAVLGDCTRARKGRDEDKVCWTLVQDAGNRRTYHIGPAFGPREVVDMGQAQESGWVRIPTVDPAAHAAFLAWAKEQGYEHLEPAGFRPEESSWSVTDSSPDEYLYALHYPVEGGRTIQVFRQGDVWKTEEVHWQVSVGKPSWREALEHILRSYRPGWQVKVIMEEDGVVIAGLVWPDNLPDSVSLNIYRFIRGRDGLWRGYMTYDLVGHPDSSYGTPEDVLIAFALKNFPEHPIGGDCSQAREDRDSGKICWMLKSDSGDRRVYMIGPVPNPEEVVEMERRDPGWWIFPPERSSQL